MSKYNLFPEYIEFRYIRLPLLFRPFRHRIFPTVLKFFQKFLIQFTAAVLRQLDYITTNATPCQHPFLIFLKSQLLSKLLIIVSKAHTLSVFTLVTSFAGATLFKTQM